MLKPQDALIWTMVLVSASDRNMTDRELAAMGDVVQHLPVFGRYPPSHISQAARECAAVLEGDDGLDKVLDMIRSALSPRLRETAYVFACDVAAADGRATQEELRVLEIIRHRLDIDRLVAAAIERAARARWQHA